MHSFNAMHSLQCARETNVFYGAFGIILQRNVKSKNIQFGDLFLSGQVDCKAHKYKT